MSSPTEKNSDSKGCKRRRTQRLSNISLISQPKPKPVPVPVLSPVKINSSTSSSDGFSGLITDEKDLELAHNLVLLSQGGNLIDQAAAQQSSGTPTSQSQPPSIEVEKVSAEVEVEIERHDVIIPSHQLIESTTPTIDHDYPCKICNKSFNSFQALGGHRASHKRPKLGSNEPKMQSSTDTDTAPTSSGKNLKLDTITNIKDEIHQVNLQVVRPPVMPVDNKARIHKCPECPAVFNSGQALGGHMRKHKPLKRKNENPIDDLDGIVIQQPSTSDQDSIVIQQQQQQNNDLDGIAIQQQQLPNGDLIRIRLQQQPNGSLVLDLNLPAQPDQQETIEQSPTAYMCDGSPLSTELSLGMLD